MKARRTKLRRKSFELSILRERKKHQEALETSKKCILLNQYTTDGLACKFEFIYGLYVSQAGIKWGREC